MRRARERVRGEGVSEPIRPKEAWDVFKQVHDHIQQVGMVDKATDDAVKIVQDFIRQEMSK